MITGAKFKTLEVAGIAPAIRGMRNPKKSWDRSDSYKDPTGKSVIGPKDLELAQTLIKGGDVHSKFLRQIMVWVDITAPLYWWSEFDTYKVGVTRDSCSTMHTLLNEIKTLDPDINQGDIANLFEIADVHDVNDILEVFRKLRAIALDPVLSVSEKKTRAKRILPSSFLLLSTVSMSYQNLRNMVRWRQTHELPAWRVDFTEWVKTLPYADDLIFFNNGGTK